MDSIRNYRKEIEEWKQIACDKNKRIRSLESDLENHRRTLKQVAAERDELKRELRQSSIAFEAVDRELLELKARI